MSLFWFLFKNYIWMGVLLLSSLFVLHAEQPTNKLPPISKQIGGANLFKKIKNAKEQGLPVDGSIQEKTYINQRVDLSVFGAGTNLIFVADEKGN
jgi:hypothetical protein